MLPRVLEPEVMDTAEEAHDYDAMDHAAVNRVFVEDFLAAWEGAGFAAPAAPRPSTGGGASGVGDPVVLDVGTATAQIPVALCGRHATVQVVAIDLAEHMLRVGKQNVARAGLEDRVRLERRDAKRLPYPDGTFAAVISNSIVHHIPEPAAVFAEVVRVAKPGALLFVRDLLRPSDETALRRLVQLHAGGANAHQQKMFADSLHAALTLDEVRGLVGALGFAADTLAQTTDRHWTWLARKPQSIP
jgi:ubiquinone/menaquinone biosynthesis C-methylase UbiE